MPAKKRLILLCGFLIFLSGSLSSCGGGGGDSAPSKTTFSISGMVTGDTVADVTGVTINLTDAATASTTTAAGNFSFNGLTSGLYTLTPIKTGYTFTPSNLLVTVSGADVTGADFKADAPSINGDAYLYVPQATFKLGRPPSASGSSSVPTVNSVTHSGNMIMNSTIIWSVTWTVTTENVTSMNLYIPEIGGYFEYSVTTQEAADGVAQIEMTETDTRPTAVSGCVGEGTQHGWWCYAEAPSGTTEDASVSLIGSSGDVGQPTGGIGITWGSSTVCGNGICESGETSSNCPNDCGPVCGNGICESGENSSNCSSDCPTVCGNGICESGENSSNCPSDCGSSSINCGGSGITTCSPGTGGCGVTVSACADTGAAWYVVNSASIYCCAGTNCAAAAQTVANIIAAACTP